ncbi:hypothetical protein GOP47_0030829 [Adiantum capillus-veneris]|nr:hypothetical protein GOP47_0030829 [Adiantum capillus-veneris]
MARQPHKESSRPILESSASSPQFWATLSSHLNTKQLQEILHSGIFQKRPDIFIVIELQYKVCLLNVGCSGVLSCNAGIIRIAVGGAAATVVLIILTLCWIVKAKLFKKPEAKPELDLENLTERPIEMSYSSLVSATSNFMNTLGEGGFGIVYRGSLKAGVQIAVKVMEVASTHRKDHLLNEVATIGRIHHVHLVRLLGFCVEKQHRILVYEYVKNGSLDKWLFCKHKNDSVMFLHWRQR